MISTSRVPDDHEQFAAGHDEVSSAHGGVLAGDALSGRHEAANHPIDIQGRRIFRIRFRRTHEGLVGSATGEQNMEGAVVVDDVLRKAQSQVVHSRSHVPDCNQLVRQLPAHSPEHNPAIERMLQKLVWGLIPLPRNDGGADAVRVVRRRRERGGEHDHTVDKPVSLANADERFREHAGLSCAEVEEAVRVRVRLVEVEEDPGAVVGADEARPGREDGEVAVVGVDAAAAENASGAEEGGVVAGARGEEEPRERRWRGRGRRGLGLSLDEAVDPVVPRLADEGHAAAVVLARDAAEYRHHQVVGELLDPQKVRRLAWRLGYGGHGGGAVGGRRERREGGRG